MKNKAMKIYYRGPDLGSEGGIPVGGGLLLKQKFAIKTSGSGA